MAAGDVTLKRGASVALTMSLASLATSSTRTAGRESTAVTTTDPVVGYLIDGKITTGTTPTAGKQIDIWAYRSQNDTPAYPDVIVGTDGARTITSENVRNGALRLMASIVVDATTDRVYPFQFELVFSGLLPKTWGLFVAHDTVAAFHATAGNHVLTYTPVYANVAP